MAGPQRRALIAHGLKSKAEGIEHISKVLKVLVENSTRVVGTNALREIIKEIDQAASDLRDRATDLTS